MKLHHVHVYTTIRVKLAVTAGNHAEAMARAEDIVGKGTFPVRLLPNHAAVLDAESADEISDYLVDEADDPEFDNSRYYDAQFRPHEHHPI